MSSLYKYIIGILLCLCGILGVLAVVKASSAKRYKAEYKRELSNIKAAEAENDFLNEKIYFFKNTVDELIASRDSITQKMNEARKELKIKDNALKQLQYSLTSATRTDTLILRDTIFRNVDFQMDTTIGDRWYNVKLRMQYPSTIAVSPELISERYVFASNVKKTIDKPKKFFICRWFQKKYTTVEIGVLERNPYIKSEKSRYIEIVR